MLFEYIASKFDAINYNGANSALDYQLIMRSKSIGEAEIDEVRETVPYMNGDYDFTGKFAPVSYRNRKITVSFKMFMESENDLWQRKSEIINWLTSERGGELTFDSIKDFIFKKCSCKIKSFKQDKRDTRYAILDIEITCAPYVQKGLPEITTLITYSGTVKDYFRYGTGNNAYFATDRSTSIRLTHPSGSNYYITQGTLPNVPCFLAVEGTSADITAEYVGSTTKSLTLLDSQVTLAGRHFRYYRYVPSLDGDSANGYIQCGPYSSITKAFLYAGEKLTYDSDREVIIMSGDETIGTLDMTSEYKISIRNAIDDMQLTQQITSEVLI